MTVRADKTAKGGRRFARRLAWAAAALGVLVVVAVAGGLAALQTAAAKRWIAGKIEETAATAGGPRLKIGAIEGFLPFSVVIRDATLSDDMGPLAQFARARAAVSVERLVVGELAISALAVEGLVVHRLPGDAAPGAAAFAWPALPDLPVTVAVARLEVTDAQVSKAVLGRAVAFDLDGGAVLDAGANRLRVNLDARWDRGRGRATASGRYLPGKRLVLTAAAAEREGGLLPQLAGLSERPAYNATVAGDGPLHAWPARLTGTIRNAALVPAEIVPLTGRDIAFSGDIVLADNGDLRFANLKASAGTASVAAAGTLTGGFGRIDAKASYVVSDLAPLSQTAGVPLAGKLTGNATITGSPDQPRIETRFTGRDVKVADVAPESLAGTVTIEGLPQRIAGRLDVSAKVHAVAARLIARYALDGGRALVLRDIEATAQGATAKGDMTLALDTGLASGALELHADDIGPAARFAGIEASGGLDGKLGLATAGGKQGATVTARLAKAKAVLNGTRVTAAAVTVRGKTPDVLAAPSGTLEVTAQRLAGAGVALASLKASISGALEAGRYTVEAAGQRGKEIRIASAGSYRIADGGAEVALRLESLKGSYGALPVAAAAPFTVTAKGETVAISPVRLLIDGQPVTARATLGPQAVDIRAEAREVPATVLRHLSDGMAFAGTLSATITITGPAAAPKGELTFAARGLGQAGAIKDGIPKLDFSGKGTLGGGALALSAKITGIGSEAFTAEGRVPMTLAFAPFKAAVPPGGPIKGQLRGATDLAALTAIVPIGESRVAGRARVALEVGGTVAAPRIGGTATVSGARYESITTGSILDKIELSAVGDGSAIRIERFAAVDGAGGRVGGSGRIALAGGTIGALDATVTLDKFRVLRLDEARVEMSGRVRLAGTPAKPQVSGDLTVERADIMIPKKLPDEVETIDVVVVDGTGERRVVRRRNTTNGNAVKRQALTVALDLGVKLPGKVFVRGRGLDSEWRGNLKVSGTTVAPLIDGKLEVVRGQMALLGKRFTLKSGTVAFSRGALSNPDLDFLAEAKAPKLTAQVRVTGNATKPVFALSSEPVLPQDEILARLLFGQDAGKLTPLQAVQLARAAAELSGEGGGGLTDRLRTAVGLDTLDFESGQNGSGSPSLRVGKYINDKIYLSIQQGTTPQDSRVGVEVEITPNVSVESSVGRTNDQNIGIIYRYDY